MDYSLHNTQAPLLRGLFVLISSRFQHGMNFFGLEFKDKPMGVRLHMRSKVVVVPVLL